MFDKKAYMKIYNRSYRLAQRGRRKEESKKYRLKYFLRIKEKRKEYQLTHKEQIGRVKNASLDNLS